MFNNKVLSEIRDTLSAAGVAALALGFAFVIFKVFEPLAPVITLAFVVGLTKLAWSHRQTRTAVLSGIVFYAAGWVTFWTTGGVLASVTLACSGMLLWFLGAGLALGTQLERTLRFVTVTSARLRA